MPGLDEALDSLARTIFHGAQPSQSINADYRHYAADVAVQVYRNNYRGNLHDALAGVYPVTLQLVGEDFFRLMTRHFIGKYPSRSGNLHHYGAEMRDFLMSFEPAQELPYLPDVAALEWACHQAWFAEDAGKLDMARLAGIASEQFPDLILTFHPACHLVYSDFPIVAIWQAHQPGMPADFHIDLDRGAGIALVSRHDAAVQVDELTEAEASWLQALQAGIKLGEATAAILAHPPEFDLQTMLLRLVKQDVLAGFNLKEQP